MKIRKKNENKNNLQNFKLFEVLSLLNPRSHLKSCLCNFKKSWTSVLKHHSVILETICEIFLCIISENTNRLRTSQPQKTANFRQNLLVLMRKKSTITNITSTNILQVIFLHKDYGIYSVKILNLAKKKVKNFIIFGVALVGLAATFSQILRSALTFLS